MTEKVYPYEVIYEYHGGGHETKSTEVYAADRDDAIKLVKTMYRRVSPKVVSAKRIGPAEERATAPVEQAPELGVEGLYRQARAAMETNPLSIRVVCKYLQLCVTDTVISEREFRERIAWAYRQIDNKLDATTPAPAR
jgi:hypothetical protein